MKLLKTKLIILKHFIKRNAFVPYTYLKYPLPIWKLLNHTRVALLKQHPPKLDSLQKRIIFELEAAGIAVTSLSELFPGEKALEKLQKYARSLEEGLSTNHKKKYLHDYWGERTELTPGNPFLQYALRPRILDIVNTYMGMYSTLLYFFLQKTSPSNERLQYSQNWHRDPQEQKIVKVFCYLNDVGMDAGPFTYIPHSAPGQKKYGRLFRQELPAGSYPGNEAVTNIVPKEDIKPMIGSAGTVIFCNTNGLHCGGIARANLRLMSTFAYAAATYRENQEYHYNTNFEKSLTSLPLQSQFAIRKEWMDP